MRDTLKSRCKVIGWALYDSICCMLFFTWGCLPSPFESIEAEAESVLAILNSTDSLQVMKEGAEDSLYG